MYFIIWDTRRAEHAIRWLAQEHERKLGISSSVISPKPANCLGKAHVFMSPHGEPYVVENSRTVKNIVTEQRALPVFGSVCLG